jgi:hypothetical protein
MLLREGLRCDDLSLDMCNVAFTQTPTLDFSHVPKINPSSQDVHI